MLQMWRRQSRWGIQVRWNGEMDGRWWMWYYWHDEWCVYRWWAISQQESSSKLACCATLPPSPMYCYVCQRCFGHQYLPFIDIWQPMNPAMHRHRRVTGEHWQCWLVIKIPHGAQIRQIKLSRVSSCNSASFGMRRWWWGGSEVGFWPWWIDGGLVWQKHVICVEF